MFALFPSRTVALTLFGFQIHWYGLLYVAGFLLAFVLLPRLQKHRGLHLTKDEWSSLLSWAVLGVIAGGRLGFVLFYEPSYYLAYPSEILQVWKGGMSSHGGFLGVATMLIWYARRKNIPLRALVDCLAVPIALGLALGRLGNFINQELYGTVTSLPWAMQFDGVEGLRHPTQVYAIFKDLFIALMCFTYLKMKPSVPGRTFALFLMLYGVLRFLIEYVREQPYALTDLGFIALTRGQLLTIPVVLIGIILWFSLRQRSSGMSDDEVEMDHVS